MSDETLHRLIAAGWEFWHPRNEAKEVIAICAIRRWVPAGEDMLMFYAEADAVGVRVNPAGEAVWHRTGTVVEVATEMLGLPHPDSPTAPRLVIASPVLWTP
ncbi:hypothetical protein [Amycolatopsis magusensis]|uniref:hypothetical protein n=1 Tax=Amycolatopsis magusensis TaxID=882444 RepID=UPI0024A814C9|nr:hypothetical protein [Amycolatopsis magusensis]MDI5975938.1 hypothetical protein [Amycolatopsis magusensis]